MKFKVEMKNKAAAIKAAQRIADNNGIGAWYFYRQTSKGDGNFQTGEWDVSESESVAKNGWGRTFVPPSKLDRIPQICL